MARQCQVGAYRYAPAPPRLDLEPIGGRRGCDAGSPDQSPAFDPLIAKHRAISIALCDPDPEPQLDPEPLQRVGRDRRQSRRKPRQQARLRLDQNNPGRRRINAAKVAGECGFSEFGDRAGEFDTGRTAANDDKGQQPPAFGFVVAFLGALESDENAPAHRRGLLDRLQGASG